MQIFSVDILEPLSYTIPQFKDDYTKLDLKASELEHCTRWQFRCNALGHSL